MTTTASIERAERRIRQQEREAAARGVSNPNRLKSALGEIKSVYSSKRENMRKMIEVDEAYSRSSVATVRTRPCCTGCKTPFGICAKKECRCHA